MDPRAETETRRPRPGESGSLVLFVDGPDPRYAAIEAMLFYDDTWHAIAVPNVNREAFTEGFFGIVSRGAMDVAVDSVSLAPRQNEPLDTPLNELLVCYPLLETLRAEAGMWRCRFVALCRDDGARLALRIAEVPQPEGGWASIAVAGEAEVVSNDFRLRTAVIDALLPFDPSSRTLYYTVWQDNMDVTPDPRIGTASVGAGTGYLGTVPANGRYVGRLPQLTAPYRLCGLSSHAVIGGQPDLPRAEKYQAWYVHDQPTPGAYQHLEDFGFQALVWDANIWYLPEEQAAGHLEDAYTVIATTLAGPTTRWQMMRHWNILNPGLGELGSPAPADAGVAAHDSEAASTRTPRNQRIALHLTRGVETFDVAREPRNWRRWRSPAGDFSVYLVDARLRKARGAAADADILGERQYAWLMEGLRTDPAPLICVVGIDALHDLHDRDAAAQHPAGLAPWPRRVADRAIEALGGRDGVVTVYGNEHAATLVRNVDHNLCECGFGPIGARPAPPDTPLPPAQQTRDRHGRPVHVYAQYPTPTAAPGVEHEEGSWNFLEMHVDPSGSDPYIEMTIRNLTDATDAASRGGVPLRLAASEMGRPRTSRLPPFQTLANADVRLSRATGEPVRAYRSLANGRLPESGLIDIPPGTMLVVTTYGPAGVEARMIETLPL